MEQKGIDELLTSEPTVEEISPPEPEVTEEPQGQPRAADGKFAPKQETGVEEEPRAEEPQEPDPVPPTEQADKLPQDVYEPLKAVRNENKELKQQLEAIQQQMARQQQQPQQQEQPADFWEDPQAFLAKQFDQFGQSMMQRFQQQQVIERIEASEQAAKGRYTDYDDAFRAFQQSAMANPSLVQQMQVASDPAEFAYKTGKTALDVAKYGSVDALIDAKRAEWEEQAKAAIPQPKLPATTATDGSVGARTGPGYSGPKSIDELLG